MTTIDGEYRVPKRARVLKVITRYEDCEDSIMWKCGNCGHYEGFGVPNGAAFCSRCGAELVYPSDDEWNPDDVPADEEVLL